MNQFLLLATYVDSADKADTYLVLTALFLILVAAYWIGDTLIDSWLRRRK
jgi:hypothetical protein